MHLLGPLRSKFKILTVRNVSRINNHVIKVYENYKEGAYEHNVLMKILSADPTTFLVPKVSKMVRSSDDTFLVMEYIRGHQLENFIVKFLLFKDPEALRTFQVNGRAIRELHTLNLNGLYNSSFPSSHSEIKAEITKLSKRLAISGVLDRKFVATILDVVKEADVDDKIFSNVNLHGELYFIHILMSNGKPTLLDFHNACKGPSYYDLAMLSVSLYVSLLLPFYSAKQLIPLTDAFLAGYYGRGCKDKLLKSVKLAELYITLREILVEMRNLHSESSPITKLMTMFKMGRLKTAIERVIVPKLAT